MNKCARCSKAYYAQPLQKCTLCSENVCWRCESGGWCKGCLIEIRKPSIVFDLLNKQYSNSSKMKQHEVQHSHDDCGVVSGDDQPLFEDEEKESYVNVISNIDNNNNINGNIGIIYNNNNKNKENHDNNSNNNILKSQNNSSNINNDYYVENNNNNICDDQIVTINNNATLIPAINPTEVFVEQTHMPKEQLVCQFCGLRIESSTLVTHMKTHVKTPNLALAVRLTKLYGSTKTKKTEKNGFLCHLCDQFSSNYSYHLKTQHEDINTKKGRREAKKKSKKVLLEKNEVEVFYCPVTSCTSVSKSVKLFRQHLSRVHREQGEVTKEQEDGFVKNRQMFILDKENIFKQLLPSTSTSTLTIHESYIPSITPTVVPAPQHHTTLPQQDQLQQLEQLKQLEKFKEFEQLQKLQQLMQLQELQKQAVALQHMEMINDQQLEEPRKNLQEVSEKVQRQEEVQCSHGPNVEFVVGIADEQDTIAEQGGGADSFSNSGIDSGTDDDTDDEGEAVEDEDESDEGIDNEVDDQHKDPDYQPLPKKHVSIEDFNGESRAFLEQYQNFLLSDYCSKVATEKEFAVVLKIFHACECQSSLRGIFTNTDQFDCGFLQKFRLKADGERKKDSSMKTYTILLHNMCSYIISFKIYKKIKSIKYVDVLGLIGRLKILRASFRKKEKLDFRYSEKVEFNWIERYLTRENVAKFRTSKFHMDAVQLFNQDWGQSKLLKRKEYSAMRDILIHYILFTTSSRDGVLIEVLMDEFQAGKWIVNKGVELYQVEVFRHKTVLSSGAAYLNLTRIMFQWISTFITHIRPKVLLPLGRSADKEQHILLPWTRKIPLNDSVVKMSSGSISKRLRAMFVASGVLPPSVSGFTCNILRKATSTGMHTTAPQLDEIVSDSMSHHVNTARDFYRRPDKSVNTATAQSAIGDYWSSGKQKETPTLCSESITDNPHSLSPDKKYHIFDENEMTAIMDTFSTDAKLKDVQNDFKNLEGRIRSDLTPEKVHAKLKRMKAGLSPPCKKRLSCLPEHFKVKRRGVLAEEQLELLYVEYWQKGFTSAQQVRDRLEERGDDIPFLAIQRKFAAWREVNKNKNKNEEGY